VSCSRAGRPRNGDKIRSAYLKAGSKMAETNNQHPVALSDATSPTSATSARFASSGTPNRRCRYQPRAVEHLRRGSRPTGAIVAPRRWAHARRGRSIGQIDQVEK
jgi:hypothetical protein